MLTFAAKVHDAPLAIVNVFTSDKLVDPLMVFVPASVADPLIVVVLPLAIVKDEPL
jgi:hypothetical protein